MVCGLFSVSSQLVNLIRFSVVLGYWASILANQIMCLIINRIGGKDWPVNYISAPTPPFKSEFCQF